MKNMRRTRKREDDDDEERDKAQNCIFMMDLLSYFRGWQADEKLRFTGVIAIIMNGPLSSSHSSSSGNTRGKKLMSKVRWY
jgi:hypothetical protein